VFVVSHHKLEALLLYFDSRLSRCVRIRIARRIGRCWQRSHPLLVMHTSALRQQLTGGSSAHLSMKPSPAQPSPALLFVGAHLAACHGARREQRNGTTAEAPLPLYSRATYGRQRRGVGRCRHEPLPGARRRCRPRRNQ
jgi:hypothetical protein